jgi:hypothetical protein
VGTLGTISQSVPPGRGKLGSVVPGRGLRGLSSSRLRRESSEANSRITLLGIPLPGDQPTDMVTHCYQWRSGIGHVNDHSRTCADRNQRVREPSPVPGRKYEPCREAPSDDPVSGPSTLFDNPLLSFGSVATEAWAEDLPMTAGRGPSADRVPVLARPDLRVDAVLASRRGPARRGAGRKGHKGPAA